MRGRADELNRLFLVLLDSLALLLAYQLTARVRIGLNEFFQLGFTGESSYLLMPPLLFMLPVTLVALSIVGLYDRSRRRSRLDTIASTARGLTLGMMLILVATFFLSRNLYSRSLIGILWLISILVIGLMRLLAGSLWARLRLRGLWAQNIAIIGNGERARKIAERLQFPGSEYKVQGILLPSSAARPDGNDEECLGDIADLERIINQRQLDRVLLSDDRVSEADIARITRVCERMGVQLDLAADFLGSVPKRIWVVNGMPLVSVVSAELSRWDQIVKRLLDLATSLLLLLALTPLFLFIALLIRLDSPGPFLFKQLRRGKGGRYFWMLKFRSMGPGAQEERERLSLLNETDGALFKMREDPRVTRVGRFLRRYSLDEIPQLINVLLGEMSFVGPRPLPIEDVESNLDDPKLRYWIEKREGVLPGITGLWQVRGRSDLGFQEMLALDLYYIRNWSLLLDLQILVKTVPVVLLGKGAY